MIKLTFDQDYDPIAKQDEGHFSLHCEEKSCAILRTIRYDNTLDYPDDEMKEILNFCKNTLEHKHKINGHFDDFLRLFDEARFFLESYKVNPELCKKMKEAYNRHE